MSASDIPFDKYAPTYQLDKADKLINATVLVALMSNPDIVDWVKYEGYKPGSGGQSKIWTDLAKEYAGAL
jgi:hypothetical protein